MHRSPLTSSDIRSSTWARLVQWANEEILTLRTRNDSLSLTERETTELRSRIAQLNEMLSLAETASDGSADPLFVFDSTETRSIEDAVGKH